MLCKKCSTLHRLVRLLLLLRTCPCAVTCRRSFDSCLSWLAFRLGSMWGRAPHGAGGSSVAAGAPAAPPPPTCPRCTSEVCQAYGVPARVYHGEPIALPATLGQKVCSLHTAWPQLCSVVMSRAIALLGTRHLFPSPADLPSCGAAAHELQWTCCPPRCRCASCGSCPDPSRWHSVVVPGMLLHINSWLWSGMCRCAGSRCQVGCLPGKSQAKVLWAAARRKHPEPIVAGEEAQPRV